ncbi:esterase FE4-like [Schistocerca nitens]|uniref:esterase FE4-like n=1 Tax=Schistocerca nitens TaxID=7011 RepID=UPI0021173B25|nr:esterase FE4-like [Schistocerca nitens]
MALPAYVLLAFAALMGTMSAAEEFVTVRVSEGLVRGRRATTVQGGSYVSFQGLPYARPPVGELRFEPPQPAESWSGVRDALSEGAACIQYNLIVRQLVGSEDCLYLNVYTPQVPSGDDDSTTKLPVMVWLHGGGFVEGSGTAAAHGPDFLVDSGVILVTVNYRLGVLGFLSTGDSVVPGNMGLKDQVAALRWVKDNIINFGGDPTNVILSGVSAGASSAFMHMMSPLSKGLFHRVIAMGGSPLNPWSFSETAKERSHHLAEHFGLTTTDSIELVKFLRTIPAEKFPQAMKHALSDEDKERLFMFVFVPSVEPNVEGAFLTEHPADILHKGKYINVPLLTGVASREGKFLMKWTGLADDPEKVKHLNDNFIKVIGPDLRLHSKAERETAANKIREFYFGGKPVTNETFEELVDLLSDVYFLEGMNSTVSSMATKAEFPIYFYRFSYEGTLSPISVFTYNGVAGASHGEDGGYLFTMGETPLNLSPQSDEHKVRKMIVKMWTNFMKSGVPTEEPYDDLNIIWPKYTLKEHEFLDINVKSSIQRELEPKRLGFWRGIFPSSI